ncbi:MAG: GNAT family N-acetyltransferase [Gammaproteobacteria bacterium]|jgi:hypothetical protein|nr:GNAT family N-acetyltransferase [Gammaproteobacteria bacterium]
MKRPSTLVADDFMVPDVLETPEFRLRMLTVNDLIKDYDAVMSSVEHLKSVWPGSGWPEGLTLEEDLVDLGWHQKEFLMRRSFAYTMVTLDEATVIGCVYIYPTQVETYDSEVYLWVRASELDSGLDARLFDTVKQWLAQDWPFVSPAFPGREIDWTEWESLVE